MQPVSKPAPVEPVEIPPEAFALSDNARVLLEGSVAYHRNDCRKCHYSGAMSGPNARGPSLVNGEWRHTDGSVQGIARVIREGIPAEKVVDKERAQNDGMPGNDWYGLDEREILAIAHYLHALDAVYDEDFGGVVSE